MRVSDLAERFRTRFPTRERLVVRLGECLIEVRTNSAPLADELRRYFHSFLSDSDRADIRITAHDAPVAELALDLDLDYLVKTPDPGKTKVKEEWCDLEDGRVVRKRLTGVHFLFGHGWNAAVGPCLENPNQVINFVNNRFIEHKLNRGALLGHAAGVCLDAGDGLRGLAMAGFSGAGKSTLALHVMSLGAEFVSNDRVMVDDRPGTPDMFGVAKHPRINPGTALNNPDLAGVVPPEERARFEDLPTEELWELEHKYDALIEECYGTGRFRLDAPLSGLVILNWRFGAGPCSVAAFDPAERPDLLPAFMKSTGLFYLPDSGVCPEPSPGADVAACGDQPPERYAEVLSKAACIEFSGGVDFDTAARVCMDFLATGRLP